MGTIRHSFLESRSGPMSAGHWFCVIAVTAVPIGGEKFTAKPGSGFLLVLTKHVDYVPSPPYSKLITPSWSFEASSNLYDGHQRTACHPGIMMRPCWPKLNLPSVLDGDRLCATVFSRLALFFQSVLSGRKPRFSQSPKSSSISTWMSQNALVDPPCGRASAIQHGVSEISPVLRILTAIRLGSTFPRVWAMHYELVHENCCLLPKSVEWWIKLQQPPLRKENGGFTILIGSLNISGAWPTY
jgi:hypothetical protein